MVLETSAVGPFMAEWRRLTASSVRPEAVEAVSTAADPWTDFVSWLLDWPPDVFAVTSALIQERSVYRLAVSPRPDGRSGLRLIDRWPNDQEWVAEVRALARAWRHHLEDATPGTPTVKPPRELADFFADCRTALAAAVDRPPDAPLDQAAPETLTILFALHAIADEACVGLGVPGAPNSLPEFALYAELQLSVTGSLSRFPPSLIRVLPKLRTPQRGLTVRSFSHHLAAVRSAVDVAWLPAPPSNWLADDDRERLDLLVIPWPLAADAASFAPTPRAGSSSLPPGWGFFDFGVTARFDPEHVVELVVAAEARAGHRIHGLVFPEASLTDGEFGALTAALDRAFPGSAVPFVLAGIHAPSINLARLRAAPMFLVEQHKHHRWCLEAGQLVQYGLEATLNTAMQWWENISLHHRTLTFLPASGWFTMCHVICEDLARLDPIDHVIRAVGPTLLVALLQDGPQLRTRWPGKFATVYADDPGCSVLTVTSLGMATRCKSRHIADDQQRVVALWSEPGGYPREISLDVGAEAQWLSLQAIRVTEYTADGRDDGGWSARLTLRETASITAP